MTSKKIPVAIIGSGNIGTDLLIKIVRKSATLEVRAFVGIDPASEGLQRARRLGIPIIDNGIEGLLAMPGFADLRLVFDATSAGAHRRHADLLAAHPVQIIDLTPAALGPYVVPVVNLNDHLGERNINMVTCGGQATIPMVKAVSRVAPVAYAEIVASISSRSAGPGTRANIDEFTETTSKAIRDVGGARVGKAIIILNPAEPPLIMRDTVYCLTALDADRDDIVKSVRDMERQVKRYVPGYRLKQEVQFDRFEPDAPLNIPGIGAAAGLKVSIFLEVEGAGHYLPNYAGNLDIMTSAALATAEQLVAHRLERNP